jgi:hypothetical protein
MTKELTKAERIELVARRLVSLLYPNGSWVGTNYINDDDKLRTKFVRASHELKQALEDESCPE